MKVSVGGKSYIAGAEWHTFYARDMALAKEKELREAGLFSGTIKVDDDLYMVYGVREREKLPLLATGFLWLSSGYYTLKLDDGRYWAMIKGKDGGIIKEQVVSSPEDFQVENIGILQAFGVGNAIEARELSIQEYRAPSSIGMGAVKKIFPFILLFGGLFLLAYGGYRVYGMLFGGSKKEAVVTPTTTAQPPPQPPPPPPMFASLELDCYEEFYRSAPLSTQPSSQPYTCQRSFPETQEKGDVPSCDEFVRVLSAIAVQRGGQIQWGERQGEYLGFSYAGEAFSVDLMPLKRFQYKSLQLSLSGFANAPQLNLSGVVLCR